MPIFVLALPCLDVYVPLVCTLWRPSLDLRVEASTRAQAYVLSLASAVDMYVILSCAACLE